MSKRNRRWLRQGRSRQSLTDKRSCDRKAYHSTDAERPVGLEPLEDRLLLSVVDYRPTISVPIPLLETKGIGGADFNMDGNEDFIVISGPDLNDTTTPSVASIFTNNMQEGDVDLNLDRTDIMLFQGAGPLLVDDINLDGKMDFATLTSPFFGGSESISFYLNTTVEGASTPTFMPAQTPIVSNFSLPAGLKLSDINNDGMKDVILVAFGGGSIHVFMNTTTPGSGTVSFGPRFNFSAGDSQPQFLAVGDLTGDGKSDLAVSNPFNVFVLVNQTGTGSLTPVFASAESVYSPPPSLPHRLGLEDINRDGRLDIVTVDSDVTVLLNETTPGSSTVTLAAPVITPIPNTGNLMSFEDMNLDGVSDISFSAGSQFGVMINETPVGATTPTFFQTQVFGGGSGHVVNLNGGLPDVILGGGADNKINIRLAREPLLTITDVSILEGDNGTTNAVFEVRLTNSVHGGFTVDFETADGDASDVADYDFTAGTLTFNGDHNETHLISVPIQGDFQQEVDETFVVNLSDLSSTRLSILKAQGIGTILSEDTAPAAPPPEAAYLAKQELTAGKEPGSARAVDINNDGKDDIVTFNGRESNFSVLINQTPNGSPTINFAPAVKVTLPSGGGGAIFDVNADGKLDIVAATPGVRKLSVFLNDTVVGAMTPSFLPMQQIDFGSNTSGGMMVADLNADGRLDVTITVPAGRTMFTYINDTDPGSSTVEFVHTTRNIGNQPGGAIAGDLNGDGLPEVIVTDGSSMLLVNETPFGAFTPTYAPEITLTGQVRSAVLVDINRDGRLDYLTHEDVGENLRIRLNTTEHLASVITFAPAQTISTPRTSFGLKAVDLNEDGIVDLVFGVEDQDRVAVLLNSTPAGSNQVTLSSPTFFGTRNMPSSLSVGNFNGNGPDLVIGQREGDLEQISVLLAENFAPELSINDVTQTEGDTGRTAFEFDVSLATASDEVVTVDYATSNGTATSLRTTRIANGLSQPVFVTAAPGDLNRLFVVEKGGVVRILDLATGSLLATPFLTIPNVFNSNERGLLGLAFHPNFANNGLFYTSYSKSGGAFGQGVSHITQWSVDGDPLTDNTADANSQVEVLSFDQPFSNHNGGWIGFGPNDGMLYISSGDGGSGNDPLNSGQSLDTLLGKMLRIDVNGDDFPADANRNYAIPDDNPFANDGDADTFDEIWAWGLRNPWRPSFDRGSPIDGTGEGDLYIADVGQNRREEINVQLADSVGGENYGWRLREGTIATATGGVGGPKPLGAIDPIYDYQRNGTTSDPLFEGNSVTGGYVYRGPITGLDGDYFFGDFVSNNLWSLQFDGSNPTAHDGTNFTDLVNRNTDLTPDVGSIGSLVSFGEDAKGNLYLVDIAGEVFRIDPMSDYQPTSGTVTFNPGETSKTITVDVFSDLHVETDETFIVTLSNATSTDVSIGDGTGLGTILNEDVLDDTPPVLAGDEVTFQVPLLADAYVQRTAPSDNFGESENLLLKNSTSGFDRKVYLQFDVSELGPVQNATLDLSFFEPSGSGGENIDWAFEVYGLNDGEAGELWIEGSGQSGITGATPPNPIAWNNAPASNKSSGNQILNNATSLGTFNIFGRSADISFTSQALSDYLNQDTNGIATLIIVRNTFESPGNDNVHVAASSEHTTLAGPSLTATITPPPPSPLDDQRSVVREFSFAFAEPVYVTGHSIEILNLDTNEMVDANVLLPDYDVLNQAAEWRFPLLTGDTLAEGNYRVTLIAQHVVDYSGNAMVSDVSFDFHRFYGDINGDRIINIADLFPFRNASFSTENDPNYNEAFDNDRDGKIDISELFLFRSRFGSTLAPPLAPIQQMQQLPAIEPTADPSGALMQKLAAWQPPLTQPVNRFLPANTDGFVSPYLTRNDDPTITYDDTPQRIGDLLN